MSYLLTPAAELDLSEIWDYSLSVWGIEQAEYYIHDFKLAFERLLRNPCIGRDASYIKPGYRYLAQGSHLIFYKCNESNVLIIRILHQRMLPEAHL